uniref:Unconventional myosin-Vb-like n=1 Tax=Gouania willdenowi TaxID=441366 RepID=A0A8C5N7R1_GOUWI
ENLPELFHITHVWIPDSDAVWVSAQIIQDYKPGHKELLLQLCDRNVRYPVSSSSDLPPLGNPDILEGENDLTALSFLHEPAVLHNLRVRFLDYSSIYTYCGIVLVAINPYEQLPIYGEEVIDAYSGQDMNDMEPHIFSVAENAYRTMGREERNQSIIISGESGSGKTVSAKFTMRFFAVVGGSAQQTSVEEKVLASNPIMESIGNAKTTRNDNSSRFGKYIEIGFGRKGDIIRANMRTYLLEKSRVVFQASAERNYHIFYQLCASRDLPEMRGLKLDAPEHFRYTNQGGEMQIPGTDDMSDLELTRNSLTVLGVQPVQQMELFRILSAVLHLGNVNIEASGRSSDRSYVNADDRSLAIFSKLLGVEGSQMAHWLCHRRLTVGGEKLVKPMNGQQAVEARDALAKHIYGQLFTWTVHRLNSALRSQRGETRSFIGVLDIYGFETFECNSFEQFCINYANEKLQQQFNRHVFHLEQEEYVREELPWSRIEFSDNQECINLIEGQMGMFDLLDEECRMPKGSDENWARKLYDQHLSSKPHPHFRKPRLSNSAFIVLHFADTVQYECEGFLDKNRDTVFEELINILKASQSELVSELFQQHGNMATVANGSVRSGKRATREHKLTVGFQFRQSLQMLMDTLNSTTPHYVRCIKPNDLKEPFIFDPKRTVQQLRACGVLETIRISAAGYPSRWTYEEFFSRYRVLLRGRQSPDNARGSCTHILPELIPDPDQYCFGKTKVFFRSGQVAFLERLRAEKLRVAAVIIQSHVRGWLCRIRYTRIQWAVVTLQRYSRGMLARRLARTLRYTKAALVIQKTYRMVSVRQLFLMIRQATITIQAFTRGALTRRRHREVRAVLLLQARVRGWMERRSYRRVRTTVVFMQCCVRRKAARKQLLKLKTEARSVEKYRQLNKGMEVKLMQLQIRADQQVIKSFHLNHIIILYVLWGTVQKLENRLQEKPQPGLVISEKEVEERRRAEEKTAQEIILLTQVDHKSELHARTHTLFTFCVCVCVCVECVNQAVSQAVAAFQTELDEERRKYQGLLREFTRLEQRYDNLKEISSCEDESRGPGTCLRRSSSGQQVCVCSPPTHTFLYVSPTSLTLFHICLRFLENQLQSQRSQWEEEMEAVRRQLHQAIAASSSAAQGQVRLYTDPPLFLQMWPKTFEMSSLEDLYLKKNALFCIIFVLSTFKNVMTLPFKNIRVDVACSLPPGLPAKVLFLCVRHADVSGDQARAQSLCAAAVTAMKTALKKYTKDVEMSALWLKNAWLLHDLLLKHSHKQVHCVYTFVCSPSLGHTYTASQVMMMMMIFSPLLYLQLALLPFSSLSVQALLESETIPGLSAGKLAVSRKRSGSDPRPMGGDAPTMASVLRELGALHAALTHQAVPQTLLEQAFHQLINMMCACALNSVLLRKDLCCWSRGLQIGYNVSLLEEWIRNRNLQAGGAVAPMEPLIQAAKLLQVGKKSDGDARAIVETCTALSSQQIVKILTLYTPHSDLDEKVSVNFIRTIQVLSIIIIKNNQEMFPVSF